MARSDRRLFEICQPTTRREYTSRLKRPLDPPGMRADIGQVRNPQLVRAAATNFRSTRSAGRC